MNTDTLLEMASQNDPRAVQQLLQRHRPRLRQMVAVRLDSRLAARLDASDVVQEVLLEASQHLPDYLRERPLPFYPWLRQIAWQRLTKLYARHVGAQKRSVLREEPVMALSGQSVAWLAERLVAGGTSPSRDFLREEMARRVRHALGRLKADDREVLVLRFLEQMTMAEVAAVLEITEPAAAMRQVRALERLRELLKDRES